MCIGPEAAYAGGNPGAMGHKHFSFIYYIVRLLIKFAIWFIIDSFLQIKAAKFFRTFHRGYSTWLVILGVISIILGIILLFSPVLSALTIVWLVSVMLIVFGIMHIVQAF